MMDPMNLSRAEKETIIQELMDEAVEAISYPLTVFDDENGYSNTWYFGVIECDDDVFATFSVCDDESCLEYGESFSNFDEARESAERWACKVEEILIQNLEDLEEEEAKQIAFFRNEEKRIANFRKVD